MPKGQKAAESMKKKHAVNVERVTSYGQSADGDMLLIVFQASKKEELLLRIPYSEASALLGAVQGSSKSAASARGEKASREISGALNAATIALGPTESGRVGIRLGLTSGMRFDFVVTRNVAEQLSKALQKYVEFKDAGGPDTPQ